MAYRIIETTNDAIGLEVEINRIYGYTQELESGVILNYRFIVIGFTPSIGSLLYHTIDGYHCHDDSFYENKRIHGTVGGITFYSEKNSCKLWLINEEHEANDPCCIALRDYVSRFV